MALWIGRQKSMAAAMFVHVSDIHFGQERDHTVHINDDVKAQLIADAAQVVASLPSKTAQGILVTGDIAHSGKKEQFDAAGQWLDALAEAIGCPKHRVQMVPGNHDLDRSKLSIGGKHLLDHIREGGAKEYEEVIRNPSDRATLLARFTDYDRFCVGYGCALDEEARFATNLRIELAPNRWIRFVRLNSSLLCTGDEGEDVPELMIGARQFSIPRHPGEENIVLAHHPLHWYKDAKDVQKYIESRARVFITGHEHNPRVTVNKCNDGGDVMMLAAGAAVPFVSNESYTYTYNIIGFDWDEAKDSLLVTIHPRAWNPENTRFEADNKRLAGDKQEFTLKSPNFQALADVDAGFGALHQNSDSSPMEPVAELVSAEVIEGFLAPSPLAIEGYEITMLRFFRDLLESERLRILLDLRAIPLSSDERLTQGLERKLFDWLARQGKLPEVISIINKIISERDEGKE